jgi:hypothetical protein
VLLQACHSDPVPVQPLIVRANDSIVDPIIKEDVLPKVTFNYTGTYKLKVDRFRDYFQYHTLVLEQENDSITGTYLFKLTGPGKETFAILKGVVNGKMNQTVDNVNSGSELYITLTERDVDSLKLSSNPSAERAARQFLYAPQLGTRFSLEKNTIENNYAGGEWDTWQRIK